jgi:rhodanese-related sulfurtransferase
MPSSVKEMLAEANAAVHRLDPAEVRNRMNSGDVLIVDVRDASELASGGKLKGAVHVPLGMLEFRADPERARTTIRPFKKTRPSLSIAPRVAARR